MNARNEAMSLAFEAALEPIPDLVLDKTRIVRSWKKCKKLFGDTLQTVPRVAHEGVLDGNWLTDNSKRHSRIMHRYMKGGDMQIGTLIGKLTNKLMHVECPSDMINLDKQLVYNTAAAIFTELLLDNQVIKVRFELKGKGKSLRQYTYVVFDGEDDNSDLFSGVCDSPGEMLQLRTGFQRLPAKHKWMLKQIGSWAWKVSDFCTDELVMHGYELSAEYNSHSDNERSAHRHDRHENDYISAIGELRKKKKFYLPMFLDHRGRGCYYFAKVFGVRPGGKLWETCFIDRAEPKLLTESAVKHIKHIIYVSIHGKCSVKHAVKHFKDKDYLYAKEVDPLDVEIPDVPYGIKGENARVYRKAEAEFGKRINMNKAADALDMYLESIPCPYIFGKDLTNSGLMMAANSFLSALMLRGANMFGLQTVADSHMQFGKAHKIEHLPRTEIKDIHTPLLHGCSVHTIVEKLHEHVPNPSAFTKDSVYQHNIDAYGQEVDNIEIIAAWGAEVVTNHQNILKWTTPDGFPACHKAMMDRVPFNVYAATTRIKKGGKPFKEHKLMATMPVAFDADGRCSFGRANTTPLSHKGVAVRTRGLFADLTHSFDAMLFHRIVMWCTEVGEQGLFKHDDYMLSPDMFDGVIKVAQDFFVYLQENNLYAKALNQISGKLKKARKAPKLYIGKAAGKVRDSFNFLMP